MENNVDSKKIFIKDIELHSIEEDKLDYKSVVENIELMIENTKTPFNVVLTGKSGSGKSSIINMLKDRFDNSELYNFEKINVWKDNIGVKQFLDSKFGNKSNEESFDNEVKAEDVDNCEYQSDDNKEKKLSKPLKIIVSICNVILTFVTCLFITSIIFVIMEFLQNKQIYRANDIFFVENTYLNYSENLWVIMLLSLLLSGVVLIIKELKKQKNKTGYGSESYASKNIILNNYNAKKVEEKVEEQPAENIDIRTKNIIIIEDIDKLSVSQMLKVLEELKYCNEYENSVFIIPLSKNILKKAIDTRNKIKASGKFKPLNFEKVLDKIFQFKVNVPQTPNNRLKLYASNLVKQESSDFIEEYCDIEIFERIIRNVLIYKDVTTPRHVKKLLNNFINNKILVVNKVEKGDIEESIIQDKTFDAQLAKISVLQADFEDFYDVLFNDFNYLNILTDLYCLEKEEIKERFADVDEQLKPFFKLKYRPLKNFLKQTKNIEIKEISTLMYFTKNPNEKMYKGKPISCYILGDENISKWDNDDISNLINLIENKNDLHEFTENNFDKLLQNYSEHALDENYFDEFNENIVCLEDYITDEDYTKYLQMVTENYNNYPEQALQVFKYSKIIIPNSVMQNLVIKLEENISKENYEDTFEVIRENSDSFYEENGNVSEYVSFLVDYIKFAPKPDEVITELDENFTRIGKVYELNKNIQELENIDLDKAYSFIAKCFDNGDLDRMTYVINTMLSDANCSIDNCLKIEEKMTKYSLVDVIEYNVDDIIYAESAKQGVNIESNTDETDEQADNLSDNLVIQRAEMLENNYTLLKNLLELCAIKQIYLNPTDTMKLVEKALANKEKYMYILSIFTTIKKLERTYFYEIRRSFNEIIYASFHNAKNDAVREAALECTRYFKNTRLFKTKLTKEEEAFYNAN